MNRTERALLARGLDGQTVKRLVKSKLTLATLKSKSKAELLGLGITESSAEAILSEARPPIPNDVLTSVLFANRFTCCVCRQSDRPIILHHIVPWEESRSHDSGNLAVLCLEDHGHAHTHRELSRNLDRQAIAAAKASWEKTVKGLDAAAIIRASSIEYSSWAYFNHVRLFELADEIGIDYHQIPGFQQGRELKVVLANGRLAPRDPSSYYMYQGPDILHLHRYMISLMSAVLRRLQVFNISDYLDKGDLPFLLATGDHIFVQGAHAFKNLTGNFRGPGQETRGTRKANKVSVTFTFDNWEAISSSSHSDWLSGTKRAGTLLQVRSVEREEGTLVIRGTVLGISNGYGDLRTRDYMKTVGAFADYDPINDDDELEEV